MRKLSPAEKKNSKERKRLRDRKRRVAQRERIRVLKVEWRKKNPEKVRISQRNHYRRNRSKLLAWHKTCHLKQRMALIEYLGGKCVRCGFVDYRALQVDHILGGGRRQLEKENMGGRPEAYLSLIKQNPEKYQLLCANCNWIKRIENNEHRKVVID